MGIRLEYDTLHVIFGGLGGMLFAGGLKEDIPLLWIIGLILSLGYSPLLSNNRAYVKQWIFSVFVGIIIGIIID